MKVCLEAARIATHDEGAVFVRLQGGRVQLTSLILVFPVSRECSPILLYFASVLVQQSTRQKGLKRWTDEVKGKKQQRASQAKAENE